MASLALPAWTRPGHPIVRYETAHWLRSRIWRGVRYTLWGGVLTFVLVPAWCAVLAGVGSLGVPPAEAVLFTGSTFTLGLAGISVVAGWATGLCASLLAATLIARERERGTWAFLRLTTLSTLDIAGGKLAAVLRVLSRPMHLVAGLRLLAVGAGAATAALYLAVSDLSLRQVIEAVLSAGAPAEVGLLAASLAFSVLPGLTGWLLEPYFSVLYNSVIGLAASTLARSSAAAVVLALAAQFGLAIGLYGPAQQLAGLVFVPALARMAQPSAFIFVGVTGAQVIVLIGLHAAVLVGAGVFALTRLERLGD